MHRIKRLTIAALAVAAIIGSAAGGGVAISGPPAEAASIAVRHHQAAPQTDSFYIAGFRNWNGQWCTGLFSDSGQLLQYWGCSGGFGSLRTTVIS